MTSQSTQGHPREELYLEAVTHSTKGPARTPRFNPRNDTQHPSALSNTCLTSRVVPVETTYAEPQNWNTQIRPRSCQMLQQKGMFSLPFTTIIFSVNLTNLRVTPETAVKKCIRTSLSSHFVPATHTLKKIMFLFCAVLFVVLSAVFRQRGRHPRRPRQNSRNVSRATLVRRRRKNLGARPVQPVKPVINYDAEHQFHRSLLTSHFPRALNELTAYARHGQLPDGTNFSTPPDQRPAPSPLAPSSRRPSARLSQLFADLLPLFTRELKLDAATELRAFEKKQTEFALARKISAETFNEDDDLSILSRRLEFSDAVGAGPSNRAPPSAVPSANRDNNLSPLELLARRLEASDPGAGPSHLTESVTLPARIARHYGTSVPASPPSTALRPVVAPATLPSSPLAPVRAPTPAPVNVTVPVRHPISRGKPAWAADFKLTQFPIVRIVPLDPSTLV